ncbi:PD-(D/E)XK nuclease-like domain-containing protein [Salipiger bermudensis]|uniref:PD-(D/E)XK nuclease-like domain-containing protein n=1 Tax=Salipiger bermudensis TaxID=344736 RepID=UPI001CD67897|nr:PD-(D/E)XK nuclease-like domain-containing protein [Salipiger bermudensis]MCA0961965.1 PD-(D/E)XK nuclease-like domain-containing protein [Salipiger bermudensis]
MSATILLSGLTLLTTAPPQRATHLVRTFRPRRRPLAGRGSKSGLDVISKSPAHYLHSRTVERKAPTAAQRIGTIAHALILEPETFWHLYAAPFEAPEGALDTVPELKARLKELGEKVASSAKKSDLIEQLLPADPGAVILEIERAKHAVDVGDKEIITADELAQAEGMRDAVMAHPKAAGLLAAGSGVAELSCYWTDPGTGVLCRCRPEFFRADGVIVDLKTCLDASPEGFQKSIEKWRYHVQHAYYMDGVAQAIEQSGSDRETPTHFVFIAVEKTAPYAVGVYVLGPEDVAIGCREYRLDLARYAQSMSTGKWPAYSDKIEAISLTEWRLRREEYELEEA